MTVSRKSTLIRVRKWKGRGPLRGFLVTWDVNSADHSTAGRLRRFLYGSTARYHDRTYRYPGFVERDGVRYVGQSVVFVIPPLLRGLGGVLARRGIARAAHTAAAPPAVPGAS